MTTSPGRVADGVRAALAARGVSQAAAARHLGVAQQTVNHRQSGHRRWPVTDLVALADWLQVSLDVLCGVAPAAAPDEQAPQAERTEALDPVAAVPA